MAIYSTLETRKAAHDLHDMMELGLLPTTRPDIESQGTLFGKYPEYFSWDGKWDLGRRVVLAASEDEHVARVFLDHVTGIDSEGKLRTETLRWDVPAERVRFVPAEVKLYMEAAVDFNDIVADMNKLGTPMDPLA